jgi:hypothetical protein
MRGQRNRTRIAQVTARLIAEHGMGDWAAAKRKACRELGLSGNERLPTDDEVEEELRNYNTLFQAATHPTALRSQRALALEWMERLAEWQPNLVGGVAEGWATPHSDVCLELEADDSKAVELALINAGIAYNASASSTGADAPVSLLIERPGAAVRLSIVTPQRRRHRTRRDDIRMSIADVRTALDVPDEATSASTGG